MPYRHQLPLPLSTAALLHQRHLSELCVAAERFRIPGVCSSNDDKVRVGPSLDRTADTLEEDLVLNMAASNTWQPRLSNSQHLLLCSAGGSPTIPACS
jgi:hypothetical protein